MHQKAAFSGALVLSALASGKSQLFHCDESEDVKGCEVGLDQPGR
jgi:hypothetical protein